MFCERLLINYELINQCHLSYVLQVITSIREVLVSTIGKCCYVSYYGPDYRVQCKSETVNDQCGRSDPVTTSHTVADPTMELKVS